MHMHICFKIHVYICLQWLLQACMVWVQTDLGLTLSMQAHLQPAAKAVRLGSSLSGFRTEPTLNCAENSTFVFDKTEVCR